MLSKDEKIKDFTIKQLKMFYRTYNDIFSFSLNVMRLLANQF